MSKFLAAATALFIPLSGQAIVAPAAADNGHANHAQLWPKPNPRSPGPWKGRKLYDLYQATETPREWFSELFTHARQLGIEIFSSVFSPEDVDFLEQFNPAAYKIASMEFTDTNLTGAGKTAASVGVKIGLTFVGAATPALQQVSRLPQYPQATASPGGTQS
jgi:sialic acid synthase SpsE